MNLQYGGTKRTIKKDRENALRGVDHDNVAKKQAAAVNILVDAFLKDKSINDDTTVNVQAVSTERALSVNITLDQQTFVNQTPEATESNSKPLTKKAEREKQEANAKTVVKKVERIDITDAKDGTPAAIREELEKEGK